MGIALFVCAGYYLGCRLGFVLRFPPAIPSVLWPPNAILTGTLLLTPPHRWWIYLLAALPAHLLVELEVGLPIALVVALFATNCSEALIAALCVRRFSDAPARFDTLRRAVVFIAGAGIAAPFFSSFLDAWAVSWLQPAPYWLVWRTRFFSNVLTALTLVPALIMLITAGPTWLRTASLRRWVEATLLAAALVLAAFVAFAGFDEGPGAIPGSPLSPLAFVLPFPLWAALRFGPGGVSLSMLTTVWIAISAGMRGRGPFTTLAPDEAVLALQIFLSVMAIPLTCLAGVIEERRQANRALEERLRFEAVLARLSGAFVHLPSKEMDGALDSWLATLGEFFGLDRLTLVQLPEAPSSAPAERSWTALGAERAPSSPPVRAPRVVERSGAFPPPNGGPSEPRLDGSPGQRPGDFTIPLVAGGRPVGALGIGRALTEGAWPEPLLQRLHLVAEVFASALGRKLTEDALRASELMKSAILASLTSAVAVLDQSGHIIAVNEGWMSLASEFGGSAAATSVGVDYLDVFRRAVSGGVPAAGEALAGLEDVLGGSRAAFVLEYPSRAAARERWFSMSVAPLRRLEGGAIVSHTEITERRRAEMEAQQSRQELAHFTRVSTMGALAASLAHELNQPLTGILTNAQAARRFLGASPPVLGELDDILTDIVEDDRRASDVIQRLRELLRKGEPQLSSLDLNVLIRDVVRLLGSDAIIRNVSIALELAPGLPIVSGDRVQLQQVILNLLVNAMDAVAEAAVADRRVTVRTRGETQGIQVSVEDMGTGLRDDAADKVFEPFYTTKPTGMGMGLTISRSIVEAHGGLIWAMNNRMRGATFHVALPVGRTSGHDFA